MAAKKQKKYDDYELALDIAKAELAYKGIGQKHGLSRSMVAMIARGDARLDLKPLIDKCSAAMVTEIVRLARSRGRIALKRLNAIIASEDEETSLKAIRQTLRIAGADRTDEASSDLKAVVIKTPFAIDTSKIKSNGKGGNGKKTGGNGRKNGSKRKNGTNGKKNGKKKPNGKG